MPRISLKGGRAKTPTLCWTCQNAVPGPDKGCTWSRQFKPVEGWKARSTPVLIGLPKDRYVESYTVMKCPEYIPDNKKNFEEGSIIYE